jgi:hypothetical protein
MTNTAPTRMWTSASDGTACASELTWDLRVRVGSTWVRQRFTTEVAFIRKRVADVHHQLAVTSMPAARGALGAGVVAFPVGSHPLRRSRPPRPPARRASTCMHACPRSGLRVGTGFTRIRSDPRLSRFGGRPLACRWANQKSSACQRPCQESKEQCLSETMPHRPRRSPCVSRGSPLCPFATSNPQWRATACKYELCVACLRHQDQSAPFRPSAPPKLSSSECIAPQILLQSAPALGSPHQQRWQMALP